MQEDWSRVNAVKSSKELKKQKQKQEGSKEGSNGFRLRAAQMMLLLTLQYRNIIWAHPKV